MKCSRSWEVRAVDEGRLGPADVAALERHARSCAECAQARRSLEDLRTVTNQLTLADPNELDVRRVRARVLHDAMSASSSRSSTRRLLLALALAGAAMTALAFALVRAPKPKLPVPALAFEGRVTPAPLAQWAQSREGTVERVTLTEGELRLHVEKQSPGERFLVVVPDGEVEVRGTTFEISVHDGHAARVHVDDGIVVVRVHGEAVIVAGGTWLAPSASVVTVPASNGASANAPPSLDASPQLAVSPPGPVGRSSVPSRAQVARARGDAAPDGVPAGASDSEMAEYQHAIDAYRLGRFEEAGELLHAFAAAHPTSALLEDASFIEAASAASDGRLALAADLAERHLARFPASFHKKEAAILIARSRRERSDCEGARSVLAPWLGGSTLDQAVVTALGRCSNVRP